MTPADLVQRQLDAYNARNLEAFCICFANDVQVFRPPAMTPSISGKAAFAEFYATQRFNLPALRAELLNRIVLGNKVIDHERIYGVREQPFEMAVVFDIRDGLIQTMWSFATE